MFIKYLLFMSRFTDALRAARYIERMSPEELARLDNNGIVALTLEGIHKAAAAEEKEDHTRGVLLDVRVKGLADKVVKVLRA